MFACCMLCGRGAHGVLYQSAPYIHMAISLRQDPERLGLMNHHIVRELHLRTHLAWWNLSLFEAQKYGKTM